MEIFTPDQIHRLINATGWVRKDIERDGKKQRLWIQMDRVESLIYETLIRMAVDTGMRQGEVLGILIDQGENIKYIQTQLGHSKASTTLDIYGHLMKTENPEAAKKSGELIFADFGGRLLKSGSKPVANETSGNSEGSESLASQACPRSSGG